MRTRVALGNATSALVIVALFASLVPAAPGATADHGEAVPGPDPWLIPDSALIGYSLIPPPQLPGLVAEHRGAIERIDATLKFVMVAVPPENMEAFLHEARGLLGVTYAKQDGRIEASYVPNDPRYPQQWGPPAIQMEAAWDTSLGSHDITVAIVDTGIDYTHPDLNDNVCVLGPDYPNGDMDPMDDHFHGTHVGGTVAAEIGNGLGVAGMANACLMAVKVLDGGGGGQWGDLASALVWAADNGADIVSMSLGGCPDCNPGEPVASAMQYAYSAGVLIVSAAGNAYCSPVSYPAAFPESMAIAALDPPGTATAEFSSCGDKVEVAAPGRDVISTVPPFDDPSGYNSYSGTSMATPHVSGVAAQFWSVNPTLTAADVRCVMAQNADDIMDPGKDPNTGFGRVDAAAMLANPSCVPQPPLAAKLTALSGDGTALLGWNTPFSWGAVSSYNLYRGTSPEALSLHATLGLVNNFEDTAVVAGTTYYYMLTAVNDAGEGDPSNVASVTPMNALTLPFVEDAESGAAGWAMDGLWHVTTDRSSSPDHSLYYGMENGLGLDDNSYDTGSSNKGFLTSPPITLEGLTAASLTFWQHFDVEGYPWEHPRVSIASSANPGSFQPVYAETGVTQGTFTAGIDLADFLGQVIYVRFEFDTIDPIANSGEGWYVDDLDFRPEALPNLPPTVEVLFPAEGGFAAADGTMYGVYADGNGVDEVTTVEVSLDGGAWQPASLDFGSWYFAYGGLADGPHTMQARAADAESTSDVATVNFVVDSGVPTVDLTSPTAETQARCTVLIEGTATDTGGSGLAYLFAFVDGGFAGFEPLSGDSQAFSLQGDIRDVAPGVHDLELQVYDNAGNGAVVQTTFERVATDLGECLAEAVVVSHADGDAVSGVQELEVHVFAPADATFTDAYLAIDGALVAYSDAPTFSFTWDTATVPEGPHLIQTQVYSDFGWGPLRSITLNVVQTGLDVDEFAGVVGCSASAAGAVTSDFCAAPQSILRPQVGGGLTSARFELSWQDGPVPDLDDLGLTFNLNRHVFSAQATEGNSLVLEIADPDGGYLTTHLTGTMLQVRASSDQANAALMTPFELRVTWAYNFAALPPLE